MSKEHKAVCVIAWPAGHSRSPLIHNYWINQHKLDAEYRREAVPPDKFAAFVENLRGNGYIGANITVPHKEAALAASCLVALSGVGYLEAAQTLKAMAERATRRRREQ